jgi:hypothetical protein
MEPTTEEIKHWSLQQPPVIATLPLPTTGSIYIDTLVESQQQQQHDTVLPTVILTGTYSDESSVASMEIRSPFAEHFEQNASADDTMTEISTENCEKQSISPISRASNLSETLANVSIEIPDSFLADTTTSSQNRPRSNANFEPAGTSDRLSDEQSVVSFTKSPVIYRAISDWGEIEGDLRIEAGQIVCLIEQQSDPQWIYAELFDSEMKPTGKRGILPISVLEHDSDGSANHTIY